MLECRWEPLDELFADSRLVALLAEQWNDLSSVRLPLDPDWERMLAAERAGFFRVWTMRKNEELAGFIQWQIFEPFGYKDSRFAWDCGHYLAEQWRNPWIWLRMWRGAEGALRALGVSIVRGHDNAKQPMGPAFKRLGYTPIGTLFERAL